MANTVIGSSIVIDGEITAEDGLVIFGTVKGRIQVAQTLVVEAGATVEANVKALRIVIADGASFKGNVDVDA